MQVMTRIISLILVLAMAACASSDGAGPIEGAVALRGRVDRHMADAVRNGLAEGYRVFTIDSSRGGFNIVAAVIAGYLRGSDASLIAIGECWSACATILLGVEHKAATASADVRIHGARYAAPGINRDNEAPARDLAAYALAHGLSPELARKRAMGFNLYRFSPEELASAGVQRR